MKSRNYLQRSSIITGLALALALAAYAPSAHANVYATNIKLNGSLTGTTSAQGGVVTITYILNEAALNGTTIKILSGATVVNTINIASGAGTLRGLNTVYWGCTNSLGAKVPVGTYSVAIAPGTSGYGSWTQTSVDANAGNAAHYPYGIDVDRNTNSPYYGRVVMGCAAGTGPDPATDGLYKMNADGSKADEGWYGYANYTKNDAGATATGRMPSGGNGGGPLTIRIGEDDRIYWSDNSANGAIVACDILATTNQIVFNEANYAGCPDLSLLNVGGYGWQEFDVCALGTTNAAIYVVDWGDYPSAGIWMWHLTNAVAGAGLVADPNDTVGTQVIEAGNAGDANFVVAGAGIMVDYNLDLFVGQDRNHATDALNRVFDYTNWNNGTLPPGGSTTSQANSGAVPVNWAVGTLDATSGGGYDTVIDSRVKPTMVAFAMAAGDPVAGGYNGANGGIRVLSAADGSTIVTNLDLANWYNGVAFDNVGNIYGASRSANYWRVWSPPGPNTNTTVAVGQVTVIQPLSITHITVVGTTVTIYFTGPASAAASAFTLYSSGSVTAPLTVVAPPATISTLSPAGNFQAVSTTSGSTQYYQVYGP